MAAVNLNHQQFTEALGAGKAILVDYWAPWCGYCRRIGPAYEKIAEEYGDKLLVAKVNIDEEALLAHQQNIEVIPTLILYKDGKVLDTVVAPESKAAIDAFIHKNLG
ncbi:MAG: thioredoxin [Oscillospiraceae bacterium]|nr:thioredoxin [Oscillospiraceae bacterium]MBQ9929613.1 thioredoxin [Oscillospiraceae bacterium]